MISVEVHLLNTLTKYASGSPWFRLSVPDNATVDDVLRRLPVPEADVFLAMHNGANIMRGYGFGSGIERQRVLHDGDVLALSGPVPFSRGYGAAVV